MVIAIWRGIQRIIGFGQPTRPRRCLIGFVVKFLNDWSTDFSSLLSYNFIVALLPLAVAAFGIFGLVFRNNPDARKNIVDKIIDSLPDNNTKTAVRQVTDIAADDLAADAGGILAIGIVFAIYGASRLFIAIEKVLNIVYRAPTRSFIKQNLVAFGMLFLFIFLIILIIAAAGAPSFLINVIPGQNGAQFGIFVAGIVISILVGFVLFFFIYWLVPNKPIKFKHIWLGALIAGFLLHIFLLLFPLYIRRFMGSFLGLIGFAVLLILFFYYFSIILIFGAQINSYFFEILQPLPEDVGTFVSDGFKRLPSASARTVVNLNPYPRPMPAYRY